LGVVRPRNVDRPDGPWRRCSETERPDDSVRHGRGLQAAPGREEYCERGQLQDEASRHRRQMCIGWVMPVGRGPPGDDETAKALEPEGSAHVENAEGGVGAARDLLREVSR